MVVLFFLINQTIIPSLLDLRKNYYKSVKSDGYEVGFADSFKSDNQPAGIKVSELLVKFFNYFAVYNFSSNVLCPRDGQSYELSAKSNELSCNEICNIQDPLETNKNLGDQVSKLIVRR